MSKGLGKLYNRLTWPLNEHEIQGLLQTIKAHTLIFQFALTVDEGTVLSRVSGQASKMISESQQ